MVRAPVNESNPRSPSNGAKRGSGRPSMHFFIARRVSDDEAYGAQSAGLGRLRRGESSFGFLCNSISRPCHGSSIVRSDIGGNICSQLLHIVRRSRTECPRHSNRGRHSRPDVGVFAGRPGGQDHARGGLGNDRDVGDVCVLRLFLCLGDDCCFRIHRCAAGTSPGLVRPGERRHGGAGGGTFSYVGNISSHARRVGPWPW